MRWLQTSFAAAMAALLSLPLLAASSAPPTANYFHNVALSPAWQAYLQQSKDDALLLQHAEQAELQATGVAQLLPAPKAKNFGLDAIRSSADLQAVLSFQTVLGGFSKRTNMQKPRQPGMLAGSEPKYIPTFDNGATSTQLRWLASYYQQATAVEQAQIQRALHQGIRYLLRAQYPNGGFPQSYPLRGGYHDAITLNDRVMTDVLQLLWDISHSPTFTMLEASLRQQAALAFARGVDWLLAAQVILDGKRTVWTAQHHPLSAEPVAARKYEQISLISTESAAVMQLLLATVPQQAGVVPALCAGIDWLQRQQIRNTIWQRHATGSQLIEQPGAMIWARFYSLTTQQPVFFDRDGQVYQDVRQLSLERQQGYAWYQTDPKNLLRAWEQQPALQAQCQQLDAAPPAAAYRNGTNLMSMFQRYSLTMMARPPLQE